MPPVLVVAGRTSSSTVGQLAESGPWDGTGATGTLGPMFDVDWFGLLTRDVLRERTPALVAEACAWAVGLSDTPHLLRREGRIAPSGLTVGERALRGLPLAAETDVPLDLADAVPGSFRDVLGALGPAGGTHADRFDTEMLAPFVLDVCLLAAQRAAKDRPGEWAELADDVGEDPADPAGVVRSGGWEAPLRTDAEILVLAALGDLPLIEVEAEGLPLSLVRAAEAVTRGAAAPVPAPPDDDDLAAVLFLAEAALRTSRPADATAVLTALRAEGLADDEVLTALPLLPLPPATADRVRRLVEAGS
jgi:hypothetical protein